MASQHLSIRLPQETIERLNTFSKRSNRTRSETAKTLIEEGLRMAAHPGVIFRDGPSGRRPGLIDGPDIWEIARVFNGCVDEGQAEGVDLIQRAEALTGLNPRQLRTALRYYAEFTDEVDAWLASIDDEADQLQAASQREQQFMHR
jgi:hypothetical protein